MKTRGIWVKKPVQMVCPWCYSPYSYYRKRTNDYLCRKCGQSYMLPRAPKNKVPGKTGKEKA